MKKKTRQTLRQVQKIIYDHFGEIMQVEDTIQMGKDEMSKTKKDTFRFIRWWNGKQCKHKIKDAE
ncbi:MAG: hypothetical protein ACTTKN_07645 [Phocaeicola sp.]|uniref:hypothetical protein n=1 Tax=Phocaeicola sp. TaxID=2773926 RepID=UPI003FA14C70